MKITKQSLIYSSIEVYQFECLITNMPRTRMHTCWLIAGQPRGQVCCSSRVTSIHTTSIQSACIIQSAVQSKRKVAIGLTDGACGMITEQLCQCYSWKISSPGSYMPQGVCVLVTEGYSGILSHGETISIDMRLTLFMWHMPDNVTEGVPNTALGCNHQSICMPRIQPSCSAILVPISSPKWWNLG